MHKNDFWVISLVALTVIAFCTGWSIWIAIAVIANSIVVIIDVIVRLRSLIKSRKV